MQLYARGLKVYILRADITVCILQRFSPCAWKMATRRSRSQSQHLNHDDDKGIAGTTGRQRKHLNVEYESDNTNKKAQTASPAAKKKRKESAQKQKIVDQKDKTCEWEPNRWRLQLQNIREMRKARDAPVDIMGCSELSDRSESLEVQ